MRPRLALFDIDHTLIDVLRFHDRAFRRTLTEVFGVAVDLDSVEFSGQTTPTILRSLGIAAGVPAPEVQAKLPETLEVFTAALLGGLEPDLRPYLLPGIPDLLDELRRAGLPLAVASGNPERVGLAVLGRAGLLARFQVCTFGDRAADRNQLLAMALERGARSLGGGLQANQVVVVGDSVHDVRAARSLGMRTLAVGTGLTTAADLSAAGPDHLLPDLSDVTSTAALILAG